MLDCGFSIVDEIVTKRMKLGEEAILGTVNEIVRDNGSLFREYIINEDFIIDALTKKIPRKIFHQGYEYEGQMIYPVGINGIPYDLCPNCKTNLCTDGFLGRDKKRMNYCKNCGQKLDWSE